MGKKLLEPENIRKNPKGKNPNKSKGKTKRQEIV